MVLVFVTMFYPVPNWVEMTIFLPFVATPLADPIITLMFVKPYYQAWVGFWKGQGLNAVGPGAPNH